MGLDEIAKKRLLKTCEPSLKKQYPLNVCLKVVFMNGEKRRIPSFQSANHSPVAVFNQDE
jgi:hypothetical protein